MKNFRAKKLDFSVFFIRKGNRFGEETIAKRIKLKGKQYDCIATTRQLKIFGK